MIWLASLPARRWSRFIAIALAIPLAGGASAQRAADRWISDGKDRVFRTLPPNASPSGKIAEGAVVICGDVVKRLGPLIGTAEKPDELLGGTYREYRYRMPCAAGIVLGRDAQVRPGHIQRFPLTPSNWQRNPDEGGPFIAGQRIRRFGDVLFRELAGNPRSGSGDLADRCSLERGPLVLKLDSQQGCSLEFVGDLNGDGVADFILSGGSAGADVESLYLSSPSGWTVAAQSSATD